MRPPDLRGAVARVLDRGMLMMGRRVAHGPWSTLWDDTSVRARRSLLNNKVPDMWSSAAYPSLKPLASWVKDLIARMEFMHGVRDQPTSQ